MSDELMDIIGSDPRKALAKKDATKLEALNNIMSGTVPDYAIQTHPGKGGKVFTYVSHVWITKQFNAAFENLWGMGVTNPTVWDDGSSSAVVSLYVDFPKADGTYYRRAVSEIGAFDGGGGKMSKAMMIASAVSRGVVKCAMRMFNIGSEFYEDTPEPTPKSAWKAIKTMGMNRGLTEQQIIDTIKEHKISQEQLLGRFVEAYMSVYKASLKEDSEDLPNV